MGRMRWWKKENTDRHVLDFNLVEREKGERDMAGEREWQFDYVVWNSL